MNVGDSSRANWLDVPNKTSCLIAFRIADFGDSNLAATNLGFVLGLLVGFFVLASPFGSMESDFSRGPLLREDFIRAGLVIVLEPLEVVLEGMLLLRGAKKLDNIGGAAGEGSLGACSLGAYRAVTRPVIVRAFFFGAFTFSACGGSGTED